MYLKLRATDKLLQILQRLKTLDSWQGAAGGGVKLTGKASETRLAVPGEEVSSSYSPFSGFALAAPGEEVTSLTIAGRYIRTPENIQRVRLAVQRSPSRSAVRHAAALRISDRTVRRILHKAHTARETLRLLRNFFPGRIISRFGDINWPARSPNLTDPDFFLWGLLRERVFQTRSHSIQDLKNRRDNRDTSTHVCDLTTSYDINIHSQHYSPSSHPAETFSWLENSTVREHLCLVCDAVDS
ncbi:hypothetical protein ANN_15383 [Periplaneta americana]|uniref:Uncharacterized protein n=1 Tax=Periplaneta americana TaxID=6978 RepID=A0ABQ8SH34_PERAM|nr:hypothetical protein ANN_15383 [Periplaneta americana]